MSELLASTKDSSPMNYCPNKAIVYVWNQGTIQEITPREYLLERDLWMWKYVYLHDPDMGKWNAVMTSFSHNHFYIYKKNMKNARRACFPYKSAMYLVSRLEVPKDFKANLFLLGVQI